MANYDCAIEQKGDEEKKKFLFTTMCVQLRTWIEI